MSLGFPYEELLPVFAIIDVHKPKKLDKIFNNILQFFRRFAA